MTELVDASGVGVFDTDYETSIEGERNYVNDSGPASMTSFYRIVSLQEHPPIQQDIQMDFAHVTEL